MKRLFKVFCVVALGVRLLSSGLAAAESETEYDVATDHAIAGQKYVLIIVRGEEDCLSLTDYDDSILYIQQKTAVDSILSFENVKPIDFEMATAFIISEEGILAKAVVLDNSPVSILVLPASIKTIEEGAFDGVSASIVKIPDGLLTIRKGAFANCPNLKEIYIPSSVNAIEENVFQNSPNVVIYGCGGSVAEEYAIQNEIQFIAID